MTKLSPKAEQALQALRDKDLEYRKRRQQLDQDLKQQLADRLADIRRDRDNALILAANAGVPRTQLGKAIGTTNYRTVQEILASAGEQLTHSENGWALITTPTGYKLQITNLGNARVSGVADVTIQDGDINFVSGDPFVVPTIYREGLAEEVIGSAI